jgi:putative DNA primase/helicase
VGNIDPGEPRPKANGGVERGSRATNLDDDRPPAFSDESLALRFAGKQAERLRYVAKCSRWMIWDGKRWAEDGTLHAFDLVRAECRHIARSCKMPKIATAIASAKTVAAVDRLARSDRRLAATIDQWDANPLLLNTPAGVIDLKTGTMRGHSPDDYLTRMTAVAAGGKCPRWLAFLQRVTNSDPDLVSFLQRLVGYALTGLTIEHTLVFLYGTGSNGKGVFLNTVSAMLGDYAKTAQIETFTASTSDRHPTELAGLRGARLVTAAETEAGRRWAESRIKTLTGGDKIEARFMRRDFFEFTPEFKLIIAGNHKPGLRSVDEAIRRRFHLVPFTVTIPPEERDRELVEKLKAEWPGILEWAVAGCLDWQEMGLRPPPAVLDATAAYLEAEDTLAAWLAGCCEEDPNAFTSTSVLFGSWKAWAERASEFADSQKRFVERLESRGFRWQRTNSARGFHGLRIRQQDSEGTAHA